jgi:RND family efflux transporter MFP subunit
LAELRVERGEDRQEGSHVGRWLLLLLLLALAALAWWWLRGRAVPVRTQVARAEALVGGRRTVLNASGYVIARRQATVSSKVTGKVVEVLVEEGMQVQDGQVLARLDDTNVRASLRLAEAQAQAAKAALAETRARLEEAQKQFDRTSALASKSVASASEFDRAEAEVKSLRARLESQAAQVAVAEREVAVWQQQLEDTVIRAPFAGVAISKNAQPGEMISPISAGGGFTRTGIGTIVDMTSLEIEVDVNESFLKRVQTGQTVEAVLDAYPDWKIACKVIAIIPAADRQKATVKVRVGFAQLDPRILPDMGVKVAFLSDPAGSDDSPEVRLPRLAVREEGGNSVVWVVQDGRLARRAVTTGLAKGSEVSITSGLAEGEKVMVEGPAKPAEGQRVRELN